jgi:hypothetical protein
MPSTKGDSQVAERGAACPGVPSPRLRPPFAAAGAHLGKAGVVLALTGAMLLFGILWLNVLVPYTPLAPIPCPFESLTGYDCPGCGLQSSLANLVALRWKYVLMANILSPILLPLFFIAMLSGLADSLFGVTVFRFDLPKWVIVLGIIVVLTYGIARNIPALGVW